MALRALPGKEETAGWARPIRTPRRNHKVSMLRDNKKPAHARGSCCAAASLVEQDRLDQDFAGRWPVFAAAGYAGLGDLVQDGEPVGLNRAEDGVLRR
jgi:hypothetical protein